MPDDYQYPVKAQPSGVSTDWYTEEWAEDPNTAAPYGDNIIGGTENQDTGYVGKGFTIDPETGLWEDGQGNYGYWSSIYDKQKKADRGIVGHLYDRSREASAERIGASQNYYGDLAAGQSAALARSQLGSGDVQRRMAMAQTPQARRMSQYAGNQQAEQMLAQQAAARGQEAATAMGLKQQAFDAGTGQVMSEADQMLQMYGIERQREIGDIQREVQAHQADAVSDAAASNAIAQASMGALATAAGGMPSDERLKRRFSSPTYNNTDSLLRALRGY